MEDMKSIRENQGLTVPQLAAKATVSPQTVYRIEAGEPVTRVFVARVCRALGVEMDTVEGLKIKE